MPLKVSFVYIAFVLFRTLFSVHKVLYTGQQLMYSNGSRAIKVSPGTLNMVRLLLRSLIQLDVFKDLLWSERSAAFSCAPAEY